MRKELKPFVWLGVALLATYALFERERVHLKEKQDWLEARIAALLTEKGEGVHASMLLREQIASHEDPEWIEMVLVQKMGLVPKGKKKILLLSEQP